LRDKIPLIPGVYILLLGVMMKDKNYNIKRSIKKGILGVGGN